MPSISPDAVSGESTTVAISAAARVVGVSVDTLRKWQIRYGLGPSRVSVGGHRRYTPEDLERLAAVRALIAQGTPTAEAARHVLRTPTPGLPVGPGLPPDVLPLGARLAAAAEALDGPAVRRIVDDRLAETGVVATWEQLLRPVLRTVGARAMTSPHAVAMEHVLSHVITSAVTKAAALPARAETSPDRSSTTPSVLLACTRGEEHALPLAVLKAALAERGTRATLFEPHTPLETLVDAATDPSTATRSASPCRSRPAVVLFALLELADSAPDVLAPLRARSQLVLAGPGWPSTTTKHVLHTTNLRDTLEVVSVIL